MRKILRVPRDDGLHAVIFRLSQEQAVAESHFPRNLIRYFRDKATPPFLRLFPFKAERVKDQNGIEDWEPIELGLKLTF